MYPLKNHCVMKLIDSYSDLLHYNHAMFSKYSAGTWIDCLNAIADETCFDWPVFQSTTTELSM